jgi:hypothetical protein
MEVYIIEFKGGQQRSNSCFRSTWKQLEPWSQILCADSFPRQNALFNEYTTFTRAPVTQQVRIFRSRVRIFRSEGKLWTNRSNNDTHLLAQLVIGNQVPVPKKHKTSPKEMKSTLSTIFQHLYKLNLQRVKYHSLFDSGWSLQTKPIVLLPLDKISAKVRNGNYLVLKLESSPKFRATICPG